MLVSWLSAESHGLGPPTASPSLERTGLTPIPLFSISPQPDEAAALARVAALTAASVGVLLAADAGGAAGADEWAPAWDASVHPLLPALRLVKKKKRAG